jgi:hypothetical protein
MKTTAPISKPLPAYKITHADGSSYVTSMAANVTLADARAYFIGQVQTGEVISGRETRSTVVAVERAPSFSTL